MSLPPLVSSSPPPPDQCYDESDEDEFAFQYPDSCPVSPIHRANSENVTGFAAPFSDSSIEHANPCDKETHVIDCSTDKQSNNLFQSSSTKHVFSDVSGNVNKFEEENNIEDLNLKLDGIQIDFQNDKESTDERFNDTFDDFGVFLVSSTSQESLDESNTLPETTKTSGSDYVLSLIPTEVTSHEHQLESNAFSLDKNDLEKNFVLNNSDEKLKLECDDSKCEEMLNENFQVFRSASLEEISNMAQSLTHDLDEINANPSNNNIRLGESLNIVDSNCTTKEQNSSVEEMFHADFSHSFIPVIDNISDNSHHESIPDEMQSISDLSLEENKKSEDFDEFVVYENQNINTDAVCVSEDLDGLHNERESSKNELTSDSSSNDDFGDFDTYHPSVGSKLSDETIMLAQNISHMKTTPDSILNDKTVFGDNTIEKIFPGENVSIEDKPQNFETQDKYELRDTLGKNWSYLINYDLEQSYLFPWNNSSTQKFLLKCLGIDSRNILFGSKWNTNMPRFAANLGVQPLQPIKQNILDSTNENKPNSHCDDSAVNSIKSTNWDNEFQCEAGDFQTSSYAESLLLDLEHLMATLDQMTSSQSTCFKISDLFINASSERDDKQNITNSFNYKEDINKEERLPHPTSLNVGRKINLPDTHIFTPSDSETPWSHTIHYDDENTSNITDSITSNFEHSNVNIFEHSNVNIVEDFNEFQSFQAESSVKNDENNLTTKSELYYCDVSNENGSTVGIKSEMPKNEEHDDFGDFQSAIIEASYENKTQIYHKENLLQPIKLSPVKPVVNWPAPGNINALTFDEYSEPVFNKKVDNTNTEMFPTNLQPIILKDSKIITEHTSNVSEKLNISPEHKSFSPPLNGLTTLNNEKIYVIETHENSNSLSSDTLDFYSSDTGNHKEAGSVFSDIDSFCEYKSANIAPDIKNSQNKSDNTYLPVKSLNTNYFVNNDLPMCSFDTLSQKNVQTSNAKECNSKQILEPLSLENHSQFNQSTSQNLIQQYSFINFDLGTHNSCKNSNIVTSNSNNSEDDDGWSDFISIKPEHSQNSLSTGIKLNSHSINSGSNAIDNDDWSDFVKSELPAKNSNELKTISRNVHSLGIAHDSNQAHIKNSMSVSSTKNTVQKNLPPRINISLPHLAYISPKTNFSRNTNSHFQNL